ncbi:MAG: acetoin utilization protein AcuC, partial [Gammaproteobacteria bacterium]|nr:acetoin utilization protein AcuC [Gammaproteobacteria bacterium]
MAPQTATRDEMAGFHTQAYLDFVDKRCEEGVGYLDGGDTPALPGLNEAGRAVVGSTLDAVRRVMSGDIRYGFVPIAGLHHCGRGHAAGFCVFNDCGVAIDILRREFGLRRVAYIDIDAHHGDGVFYAFEDDVDLLFADLHEDGRFLYPGTGFAEETGKDGAAGTKLNIPMPPGAGDEQFLPAWERVRGYLDEAKPEFILLQCGADSIAGDPITHLRYTPEAHAHAARDLRELAERHCDGRLVAMGGGGYNRGNLASAWTEVVSVLSE